MGQRNDSDEKREVLPIQEKAPVEQLAQAHGAQRSGHRPYPSRVTVNREENNTDSAVFEYFLADCVAGERVCLLVSNRLQSVLRSATHAYLPRETSGIAHVRGKHLARMIQRVLKRVGASVRQELADYPVGRVVLISKNEISILHHCDHAVLRVVGVIRQLPIRILDVDQAAIQIVAIVDMVAVPVPNMRDSFLLVIFEVQSTATGRIGSNQVTGRVTWQIQPIALVVFYGEQSRLLGTLKVSAVGKIIGFTARFDKLPSRPVPRDVRARKFAPPRI